MKTRGFNEQLRRESVSKSTHRNSSYVGIIIDTSSETSLGIEPSSLTAISLTLSSLLHKAFNVLHPAVNLLFESPTEDQPFDDLTKD